MSSAASRIRRATPPDLGAVVELLNTCDEAETGAPENTARDLESKWATDGCHHGARDAWLAIDARDRAVGYACAARRLRTGDPEADVWVHPHLDGDALPERLLRHAERRARKSSAVAQAPSR